MYKPGPWELRQNHPQQWQIYTRGNVHGYAQCLVGDEERGEATARLMAAAPELLEALQNAVRCAERDGLPGSPGSAPAWTVAARAVLAKVLR